MMLSNDKIYKNYKKENFKKKNIIGIETFEKFIKESNVKNSQLVKRLMNKNEKLFENIENKKYIILSYLWYPDKINCWNIYNEGYDVKKISKNITSNILDCYIWIDKFCIIQNDDIDKQQQIPLMRDYYENSTACIIIGTNPDFLEIDIKNISKLEILTEILATLMLDKWFSRVWTVQEFILPKVCFLLTPKFIINIDEILRPLMKIPQTEDELYYLYKFKNLLKKHFLNKTTYNSKCFWYAYWLAITDIARWRTKNDNIGISEALNVIKLRQATNYQDNVYGMLGLFKKEISSKINIDYNLDTTYAYNELIKSTTLNNDLGWMLYYDPIDTYDTLIPKTRQSMLNFIQGVAKPYTKIKIEKNFLNVENINIYEITDIYYPRQNEIDCGPLQLIICLYSLAIKIFGKDKCKYIFGRETEIVLDMLGFGYDVKVINNNMFLNIKKPKYNINEPHMEYLIEFGFVLRTVWDSVHLVLLNNEYVYIGLFKKEDTKMKDIYCCHMFDNNFFGDTGWICVKSNNEMKKIGILPFMNSLIKSKYKYTGIIN
jgi:hypothetical protein